MGGNFFAHIAVPVRHVADQSGGLSFAASAALN
jgi:hypothetical protein